VKYKEPVQWLLLFGVVNGLMMPSAWLVLGCAFPLAVISFWPQGK